MQKLKTMLLALLALCAFSMSAQVVYTEPPMIQRSTKNFTLYFDATQGTGGLKDHNGDVYAHIGLITSASATGTDWKYAPDWNTDNAKYKMTKVSANLYSLKINSIDEFFGVPSTEEVKQIAMVFRSTKLTGSDGGTYNLEGKATGGKDIYVDVFAEGLEATIVAPVKVFSEKNNKVEIKAYSTVEADLAIYLNSTSSTPVKTGKGTKLTYTHTFASGNTNVIMTATAGGVTKTDEVDLCCHKASSQVSFGKERIKGTSINNDGSVTFTLYAPQKSDVMLVGEWNDFAFTNDQMMNYEGSANDKYFWVTVPAGKIDLNKEYAYYFLIDDVIEVGDPYCTLVLDPWNDKWINQYSEVYPGLKEFPSQLSGTAIISVFRGNNDKYNWEVTNFKGVDKNNLVIYEMLFRDFTNTVVDGKEKLGTGTVELAIEKLDYLKNLGINAVELMPIQEFNGNLSWGYNTNYYFAPDKAYGTPEMYKKFIDECHKRGIAVILDVVFNHAQDHPYYVMYGGVKNNPFMNEEAPHAWSVFNDWKHENTYVQEHFCEVLKYWIKEYKVDGYRFDLAKGLGTSASYANNYDAGGYNSSRIDIMKKYSNAIWSANPNAYAIYEYFVDSNEEKAMADHGGLSWKGFTGNFAQAVKGEASGSSFEGVNTYGYVTYMESHDEQRVSYIASKEAATAAKAVKARMERLGASAAFFLMSPGAKMIWQFGELGNDTNTKGSNGDNDTGEKKTSWADMDNQYRKGLHDSYQELLNIRKSNPDLFDSANRFNTKYFSWSVKESNWANGRFITLRNAAGTKEMIVAMNPSYDSKATFSYKFDNANGKYYINSKTYGSAPTFDAKAGTITLPKNAYVVISNMEEASAVETVESELAETVINIYPNPATDYVNVEGEGVKAIEVYSLAGALVASEKAETTINVSNLAKGTYLVKVTTETGVKVEKMIKK